MARRKSEYNSAFAKKLRALLKVHPKTKKPISQKDLAKSIQVTPQTVSLWVNGIMTAEMSK